MSEDSTEGGRKITRRSMLAGLAVTAGLAATRFLNKTDSSTVINSHKAEFSALFDAKVDEIKDEDKQKFLDHLKKYDLLDRTVSDNQVSTFSIKSFVIHQPEEEKIFYPKFAILPPKDQSSYLPRIIMEREERPFELVENVIKFTNGLRIVTWSTPLADKAKLDIPSASETNSPETIFKYYNGVISADTKSIIDRNLDELNYFPDNFLLNRGVPQSMQVKDSAIRQGLPIVLNKLPVLAQDYLMNGVLGLK